MNLYRLVRPKSYERLVRAISRHPITFVPHVLLFIVFLLVPAAVYFLMSGMSSTLLESQTILPLLILLASVYYLSVMLFFYTYFVTFHLDIWIITNDRLLDIEQKTLFARTIAEVDLYQIQDVTSEVKGFFPSLFNYGNVILQTAGPVPRFTLKNVADPHRLRETILDLAAEDKRYHSK